MTLWITKECTAMDDQIIINWKGCGGKCNRGLNEGIIPACACEDWGTAWKSCVRVVCIRPRFELVTACLQITDLSVWADSLVPITLNCERCFSSRGPKFAWPPYTTMHKWRRKCHVAGVKSFTAMFGRKVRGYKHTRQCEHVFSVLDTCNLSTGREG
jgi:hypothetical protein